MIVPPVFPCRSVYLFVPVCIRLALSFPFTSGSPSTSGFSFRIRFTYACQSRFASVSPSASRLHPVHYPLPVSLFASVSRMLVSPGSHQSHPQFPIYIRSPSTSGFSFRLRFTCVCQSRYSFCLLFSLSPFCPELSFPFLPSLSAPFCRPASPLPCSG